MKQPSKPFVNAFETPATDTLGHGETFAVKMAQLAAGLGAKEIGANLTRVPPGKAAFPFHHHYANEEHFFIVSGTGVLRVGNDRWPVKPGDYIVNPAGGPEHAHQLINTGAGELVYLSLSSKKLPEVVGYPDSGKHGLRVSPPGAPGVGRVLVDDTHFNKVEYFDREDGARVREVLKQPK